MAAPGRRWSAAPVLGRWPDRPWRRGQRVAQTPKPRSKLACAWRRFLPSQSFGGHIYRSNRRYSICQHIGSRRFMTRRLHLADPSQRANTGIGAERKDVTLPNGLLLTALKQSFALRPSDGKVCPIVAIQFGAEDGQSRVETAHSITSSARASSEGGTVRPSAFAVLRL